MKKINKILTLVLVLFMTLSVGCVEEITPQYKTIEHKDPIYKTLYTYELDDVGDGESSTIVHDVYNIEKEYAGSDFWGNENYIVTVYYYIGVTESVKKYYEINSIKMISSDQKIVGYNTWTEKVRVN